MRNLTNPQRLNLVWWLDFLFWKTDYCNSPLKALKIKLKAYYHVNLYAAKFPGPMEKRDIKSCFGSRSFYKTFPIIDFFFLNEFSNNFTEF